MKNFSILNSVNMYSKIYYNFWWVESKIKVKLGLLHTHVTLSLISTLIAICAHSGEKTIHPPFTSNKEEITKE